MRAEIDPLRFGALDECRAASRLAEIDAQGVEERSR